MAKTRYEHVFFSGMAILILGAVFLGFARTYFLAGVFRAPLPNWLIHVHGAAFSSWLMLLITQTSLIATHRVNVHRRLGIAGFGLACLMVVLGICAGTDLLRRGVVNSGIDPKTFYAGTMGDMLIFGTLIFFAFRMRSEPPAHKRLILMATFLLMGAGVARWPFDAIQRIPLMTDVVIWSFLLALVVYDLLSLQKIHRATMLGGAFLVVALKLELPMGRTAVWQAFATWALGLAKSIHGG